MLACYSYHRQGIEIVTVYSAQGIAGFAKGGVVGNGAALPNQGRQEQFAFSSKENMTKRNHLPPGSLCALSVAGASCHGGGCRELPKGRYYRQKNRNSASILNLTSYLNLDKWSERKIFSLTTSPARNMLYLPPKTFRDGFSTFHYKWVAPLPSLC